MCCSSSCALRAAACCLSFHSSRLRSTAIQMVCSPSSTTGCLRRAKRCLKATAVFISIEPCRQSGVSAAASSLTSSTTSPPCVTTATSSWARLAEFAFSTSANDVAALQPSRKSARYCECFVLEVPTLTSWLGTRHWARSKRERTTESKRTKVFTLIRAFRQCMLGGGIERVRTSTARRQAGPPWRETARICNRHSAC